MNKKRIVPVVALLILVAAVVVWLNWPDGRAAGMIVFSGNIEMTEVDVAFKTSGRLLERAVDEGDEVKKGMTLARLDDEQLRWQREQAVAALAAAQSRLAELDAQIRYQKENMSAQVDQRMAEVRQSEAQLKELLAGSRSQEIAQSEAAVQRALSAQRKAEGDFKRASELRQDEDISAIEFDQYKSAFESAQAELDRVRQQLDLVKEGPRTEDIEAARAQAQRSQAGLRQAQAVALDIRRSEQGRETARADIEKAKAVLSQLESQLADTVVESPTDGVVLVKHAEPGEVLAAGSSVVSVGDVDHPWLRGYIPESSLGRVRLGSKVKVTNDSYPGKAYQGEITFISSEAEFTPKQIQTPQERVKLVYRIKVSVANPERELKLNMPCDAEIELDNRSESGS